MSARKQVNKQYKQKSNSTIILGVGGTGRTALSILEACHNQTSRKTLNAAFLDDACKATSVNGYPVVGTVRQLIESGSSFISSHNLSFVVAFGCLYMTERRLAAKRIKEYGYHLKKLLHPMSYIDRHAVVGDGTILCAHTLVHPNTHVGENCVFCVGATVDHDCDLGSNVYLSPGVNVAGGVVIESNAFLGTNATVLPNVRIGEQAVIGAGAVVTRNVEAGTTVIGIPALPMEKTLP